MAKRRYLREINLEHALLIGPDPADRGPHEYTLPLPGHVAEAMEAHLATRPHLPVRDWILSAVFEKLVREGGYPAVQAGRPCPIQGLQAHLAEPADGPTGGR